MSTIRRLLCRAFLPFLFAIAACSSDSKVEDGSKSDVPEGDPVLGYRIAEGVVFDDKLWLRGGSGIYPESTGGLVSFQLSDWSRAVAFKSDVIDIERSSDALWVLHRLPGSRYAHTITQFKNGAPQEIAKFSGSRIDQPIALLINDDSPIIVSQSSVRTWRPTTRTWRVTNVRGRLQSATGFAVNSSVGMPTSGRTIYVGYDAGEWGGGMQSVDLETGALSRIEKRDPSKRYFYGGPLEGALDPVTGIVPDPTRQDCILASIGLFHLGTSSGRIVRVCGTEVEVAFENLEEFEYPAGKFVVSEAFYGIAPASGATYWAVGITGLYRFTNGASTPEKIELPRLVPMDQIYLSRDIPGAIILRTNINWAVSTSGYTPLVVSLN